MIPFIFLVIFSRVIALGNGKRILLWGSGLSGIAVAAAFLCSSGVRDCVELGHGPAHSQVEDPDQLHGAWQNQRGNKGKQVAGEDKYKDRKKQHQLAVVELGVQSPAVSSFRSDYAVWMS